MLTRKRKDHLWKILGEGKMMVENQQEVEHIDLQVEEKMEIEEMTGVLLDMIGIGGMTGVLLVMTGIGEMTEALHLDMIETGEMTGDLLLVMIVTEEMIEVLRAGAGKMIAMDKSRPGMMVTTGMTVQDHLVTREPLLNHQR